MNRRNALQGMLSCLSFCGSPKSARHSEAARESCPGELDGRWVVVEAKQRDLSPDVEEWFVTLQRENSGWGLPLADAVAVCPLIAGAIVLRHGSCALTFLMRWSKSLNKPLHVAPWPSLPPAPSFHYMGASGRVYEHTAYWYPKDAKFGIITGDPIELEA